MTLRRLAAALFSLALVSPLACKDAAKTDAKPAAEKQAK
jgi:hypothetical protein